MTELRDARLRQAMDAAPDAQLRPHARTRDAIRAAAHDAVRPAWKRWWRRAGGAGPRWTGAFATLALATLVVALWEGEEVPGARTDRAVVAQAPSAPASPAPASPPTSPSAPPPAAAPVTRPTSPPPPVALPSPSRATGTTGRTAPAARPAAPGQAGAAPQRRRAPTAPEPSRSPELADAAPVAETLSRFHGGEARRDAAAPAASAPAAAAIAQAPGAAAAPAPAAPALAQREAAAAAPAAVRGAPAPLPWSQVRIESGGRAVVVARAQAGELPALVTSMLASPSDDAGAGGEASLRLELGQGDEAGGVLEVLGERWRWSPLGHGRPPRMLRPDPAVAQALRLEAQRLLDR